MPLVTITGYPSSGKTTRAKDLETYLRHRIDEEKKSLSVEIVNDENYILKSSYKNVREEKKARDALLSEVQKKISKDKIVIVDALNHIKGFRYQLHCAARGAGTLQCTIHTGTPVDIAKGWNTSRGEEGYEDAIFDDLVSCYEEPEGRNRWDAPLFTVIYDDTDFSKDKIWEALVLKKPPPPNKSTLSKPVTSTDYLYELDKKTTGIVKEFMKIQKESGPGGQPIKLQSSSIPVINPAHTVTLSELSRTRKRFINYNKLNTTIDVNDLNDAFVKHLNSDFQE